MLLATVATFLTMVAIAAIALVGSGGFLIPFVATYVATAAWFVGIFLLMQRPSGALLTAWIGGGIVVLLASFVAQVLVARGG